MHVQLDALKLLLKSLVSYVEGIANADPVNAVEIAQSSGIPEKKAAVHTPKTFSAKLGKVKGSVMLNTKAVKGGVYIYQMTTDPNNAASWVTLVSDKVVKFTKSGLTSGVRYYFRVAVVSRSVQGDWSHELDLVVQ